METEKSKFVDYEKVVLKARRVYEDKKSELDRARGERDGSLKTLEKKFGITDIAGAKKLLKKTKEKKKDKLEELEELLHEMKKIIDGTDNG